MIRNLPPNIYGFRKKGVKTGEKRGGPGKVEHAFGEGSSPGEEKGLKWE